MIHLSRFGRALSLSPDDGSKDKDSFLTVLHESPKLVPSVEACYVLCGRLLRCNEHHVWETVAVESTNRGKVLRQRFAPLSAVMSCLMA